MICMTPTLAMGDELLVAIICMAIYEMVAWTQPSSWLHHYRGLAQLTSLRGPRRHQSGVALVLLPTLRSCITVGYLLERKHCFLESPEWKTLLWAKCGLDAKLPIEELQDLLCDLPGQLEDVDKILTWEEDELSKAALHSALCSRIFATLEALYAWRWKWEQMFPCCTYLVEPGGPDPETLLPIPPNPFTSVIWFTDPYRAQDLMTYNTIRLIATRSLETIGVHVGNTMSDRPQSDPLLPMEGTRNEVAVEICRIVDYHMHSLRRSSGAFTLIFPLNVAHLHLDQDTGEIKTWLEAVMAVVADYHGFEVGRRENMPRQLHPSKR